MKVAKIAIRALTLANEIGWRRSRNQRDRHLDRGAGFLTARAKRCITTNRDDHRARETPAVVVREFRTPNLTAKLPSLGRSWTRFGAPVSAT